MDLRFHLLSADWIPENVQQKILERVRLKYTYINLIVIKPCYSTLVTPHYDILTLV